ncbi:MAG: DNA mismatch repair protein MutS, partial [Chloroflexia bacterium]
STPVRRQYLEIKRQYPDTILFFRLGDFYETFDDDAKLVASELDIVLTARDTRGAKIPMAGVPHHSAEGYIAKLVARGYRVAVCEQVGEPNGKDVVERKVRRVVTPGTVDEPEMLDSRRSTYLAALVLGRQGAGLAYADVSTGELAATQVGGSGSYARIKEELQRLAPAEILVAEGPSSAEPSVELSFLHEPQPPEALITATEPWRWKLDRATQVVLEVLDASSLQAAGLEHSPLATRAAGGLLQYIETANSAALQTFKAVRSYSLDEYMPLDERTRRNLELAESSRGDRSSSLTAVLDGCSTPMGGRTLRRWIQQPLVELAALEHRLDVVAAFVEDDRLRDRLREEFKDVSDIERLVARSVAGSITPRELRALGASLARLPAVRELALQAPPFPVRDIQPAPDLADLLLTALVDDPPGPRSDGPVIREGYSAELDRFRNTSGEARRWIAALEKSERATTGVRNLKVGYNKVFGYYIEVGNANKAELPEHYIRKQTLVGAERYITPQLKEYETLIMNSQGQAQELEQSLLQRIVGQVRASASSLGACAVALAELDAYLSLAEASARNGYVRPTLAESGRIEIVGGRHPVVEHRAPDGFVANGCCLDAERQILLLTGPNMAGKSTYLRQVALIVLMAQIGCFVPAESAHIGLVDRIFTRVGAQDDIASGQSTFMVEMTECAYILRHCTERSLVVLDEIGRGTSTYDGLAVAQSVVEYLHNNPGSAAKTLFATHYHELNALSDTLPRVHNLRMDVLEEGESVVFLRKVVSGGADRSYGVYVARLAGLPKGVVRRAQDLLRKLELSPNGGSRGSEPEPQLTFLNPDDGLLSELSELDLEGMTPIEALTHLYELRRRAREKVQS